jgi:hypothetical protein
MKSFLTGLIAAAVLSTLPPAVRADLVLSLSAGSANLSQLQVGQTVKFDVNLSGLTSGGALDYLAGTVVYPSNLLSPPASVTSGSIVPEPSGFEGVGFPGTADAFYDAVFFSLSHTPILNDGIFFSFPVTAESPGSGSLSFDPSSLAASDGTNTPTPLAGGPPLPFTVLPSATNPVPEPSSAALLASAAGAGIVTCLGRVLISVRKRPKR